APRPSTLLTQQLVAGKVNPGKSTTGLAIPTDDENRASLRRLRLKEQIARIRGDLDWIVMKCLEKDRNRRYETANGLAMDIQRHLRNEPVVAGPPSRTYILKKFIARHKWPVVANATIVLLILAGLIGTTLGLRRATAARARADQNAALAERLTLAAQAAERAARLAETNALRQAYSAGMLGASDALERGKIDNVRSYLDSVPTGLRGWEWRHLSSQLDLSVRIFRYPRTSPSRLLVMPDGQSYYDVFGAPLGGIYRRDVETGELLATLPTRRNYLHAQLLLGGRQLLAQLGPGPSVGIELWDLERGTLLSTLPV
ncbi:MAG: hypothetical protein L6Q38_15050, partial [Nitrospira sp.]|nr:hypothetical protein [Nitrospira sp.]